ncbi:MAG TPA: hypothetical protein VGR73_10435 [Bryobacteraceae bacterium]|nr:hypothetical protein [Bryobacteraceae bacterium]
MQVFELPEVASILGLDLTKAKNWTNGRTGLLIEPSVRKATGTGTRNLFSLSDLYLFGVAQAFSGAGFAVNAIGKLAVAVKLLLEKGVAEDAVWTIWRLKPGGDFQIKPGQAKPPKGVLSHTLEIGHLIDRIDASVKRFGK